MGQNLIPISNNLSKHWAKLSLISAFQGWVSVPSQGCNLRSEENFSDCLPVRVVVYLQVTFKGRKEEVLWNKMKYQRKAEVQQAKSTIEYDGKLQRLPAILLCFSRERRYSKGKRFNSSFFKHLMLFLMALSRILLWNAPCQILDLKLCCE